MYLDLFRYGNGDDSTGGLLFVNNEHFGYMCEDEQREIKVPGETRIPARRYQILLRDEGGMNVRYHAKFSFHRGMLHLQDVPNFTFCYIHIGNDDDDTEGCPLVGFGAYKNGKEYVVTHSTPAYIALYNLILLAMDQGEEVWIDIHDNPDARL